jgi:hypothetical protein
MTTAAPIDLKNADALASMSDIEVLRYKGDLCKQFYALGKTYPAWSKERAEWWHRSLLLFNSTFLDLDLETPDFHKNWYYWRVSEKSYLNLAPRDHAKTTCHAVNSVVWEICMDRNLRFFLIFSISDVGKIVLTQVKNHLERNRKIIDVFGIFNPGQMPPDERGVNLDWSQTSITVNRSNHNLKDPTVAVAGAGSNVLSRRCDRLLCDDLITDQIAHSQAESERIYRWYFNDVYPTLESSGQEIITGTLYRLGDFYHQVMEQSQEKGGAYKVYIGDAIVDERKRLVLWPERWSYEDLMYQRQKLGISRFNRNYRNLVMQDGDSTFPMAWFEGGVDDQGVVYRGCYDEKLILGLNPQALRLKISAIGVDPALAIKHTQFGKYFAMVVLGITVEGYLVICDIVREQCNSITQRRHIVKAHSKWNPRYIAVESNAYQRALYESIEENHPHLPVYAWHTANAGPRAAETGVTSMDKYFEGGRFKIPRGNVQSVELTDLLISELHYWGVADTSDLVMALWFAFAMLKSYIENLHPLPAPSDLGYGNQDQVMGLSGRPLPYVISRTVQEHALSSGPFGHLSSLRGPRAVATPQTIVKRIQEKSRQVLQNKQKKRKTGDTAHDPAKW